MVLWFRVARFVTSEHSLPVVCMPPRMVTGLCPLPAFPCYPELCGAPFSLSHEIPPQAWGSALSGGRAGGSQSLGAAWWQVQHGLRVSQHPLNGGQGLLPEP